MIPSNEKRLNTYFKSNPFFLFQSCWKMMILSTEKAVAIVEMALSVWAIIHLADAFDVCDIRGKMTVSKGKRCYLHIYIYTFFHQP